MTKIKARRTGADRHPVSVKISPLRIGVRLTIGRFAVDLEAEEGYALADAVVDAIETKQERRKPTQPPKQPTEVA